MLEYRGLTTRPDISFDDNVIFGKILGIDDLVSFEGATPEEFLIAFYEAVDDYLGEDLPYGEE
jgi:predicted HicB family RNase H-like nuclease